MIIYYNKSPKKQVFQQNETNYDVMFYPKHFFSKNLFLKIFYFIKQKSKPSKTFYENQV